MKTELEEAGQNYAEEVCNGQFPIEYTRQQVVNHTKNDFIQGAKWQAERMYSEEDIINALHSVELKHNKDYSKIYNNMKEFLNNKK
jgi:hypothetical protein